MSQVAIKGLLTSHDDVTVVSTPNTLVTINNILIDVEGSVGGPHEHGTTTYIDQFKIAKQSFVSINGRNILQINDTGSICGSSITYYDKDKSLQNFIYIN